MLPRENFGTFRQHFGCSSEIQPGHAHSKCILLYYKFCAYFSFILQFEHYVDSKNTLSHSRSYYLQIFSQGSKVTLQNTGSDKAVFGCDICEINELSLSIYGLGFSYLGTLLAQIKCH